MLAALLSLVLYFVVALVDLQECCTAVLMVCFLLSAWLAILLGSGKVGRMNKAVQDMIRRSY